MFVVSVFQKRSYSCGRSLRCSLWQNSCSETCSMTGSISLHVHNDSGSIWCKKKKKKDEKSYLMFDLKDNKIQRNMIIQHYTCSLCRELCTKWKPCCWLYLILELEKHMVTVLCSFTRNIYKTFWQYTLRRFYIELSWVLSGTIYIEPFKGFHHRVILLI